MCTGLCDASSGAAAVAFQSTDSAASTLPASLAFVLGSAFDRAERGDGAEHLHLQSSKGQGALTLQLISRCAWTPWLGHSNARRVGCGVDEIETSDFLGYATQLLQSIPYKSIFERRRSAVAARATF